VGKRTDGIDRDITAFTAQQDARTARINELKAAPKPLTDAQREELAATRQQFAASKLEIDALKDERAEAVKDDEADEAAETHKRHLKTSTEAAATSRKAESFAAGIDRDIAALVAKIAQLTEMTAPLVESIKQVTFETSGMPALLAAVQEAQKRVATAVTSHDRVDAGADLSHLNHGYSVRLSDLSHVLPAVVQSIAPTSPAMAEAVENFFARVRAAWCGQPAPDKVLTFAAARAQATAVLEGRAAKLSERS